ncbi:MAG: GNAT family N-acetyltransferase [Candidatus Eiseniibacteriota bacterium]|nr:MAG: GNAT family N-acetyltransferase [Candidatus Eisenbacteria bacterium]
MPETLELTPFVRGDVTQEKWDRLLESSLGATVFHCREWATVLGATFKELSIKYIVIEDQRGSYVAGMPLAVSRSIVAAKYRSMPFGTYGGPLIMKGQEDEAAVFMGASLQGVTRSLLPFSFSCVLYDTPVVIERALAYVFPGGRREKVSTHLIDLEEGFQRLWDHSFDKETRTCARKAARSGVTVEEDTTHRGAAVLHGLYRKQASFWNPGRIYPERLVSEIVDRMKSRARIWLGVRQGEPVCGVLAFYFGNTLMAWLSGQSEEGRNLRASHLVYAEMMKHACENNYSVFNFGASGSLQGVRFFKESFGAREYSYSIFTYESGLFRFARRLKGAAAGV